LLQAATMRDADAALHSAGMRLQAPGASRNVV
jgi:hypothetical protein